jgi:hypothetical protein
VKRARGFWLLALLSSSCAVGGFSLVDELPGAGGDASGGQAGGGGDVVSGGAGSAGKAGSSTAGATVEGGKGGSGGSIGNAGAADAGQPSVEQGGAGEGGAPVTSGPPAACDPYEGKLPLLCDDFESGSLAVTKWSAPPGVGPEMGQGPHGATKLVHLNGPTLPTTITNFNLAAGEEVTLSFWLKVVNQVPNGIVVRFRDRSAAMPEISLIEYQNELGWMSSTSNFRVPEMPTLAVLPLKEWTCVSLHVNPARMILTYQAQGAANFNTLTVDNTATPGIDANWQNMPVDSRFVGGYPAFAGALNGAAASDIYIDDVRIAKDKSSVCAF